MGGGTDLIFYPPDDLVQGNILLQCKVTSSCGDEVKIWIDVFTLTGENIKEYSKQLTSFVVTYVGENGEDDFLLFLKYQMDQGFRAQEEKRSAEEAKKEREKRDREDRRKLELKTDMKWYLKNKPEQLGEPLTDILIHETSTPYQTLLALNVMHPILKTAVCVPLPVGDFENTSFYEKVCATVIASVERSKAADEEKAKSEILVARARQEKSRLELEKPEEETRKHNEQKQREGLDKIHILDLIRIGEAGEPDAVRAYELWRGGFRSNPDGYEMMVCCRIGDVPIEMTLKRWEENQIWFEKYGEKLQEKATDVKKQRMDANIEEDRKASDRKRKVVEDDRKVQEHEDKRSDVLKMLEAGRDMFLETAIVDPAGEVKKENNPFQDDNNLPVRCCFLVEYTQHHVYRVNLELHELKAAREYGTRFKDRVEEGLATYKNKLNHQTKRVKK